MASTIKIKRSAVAAKVPTTGDLALGELAVNTYDGKLFMKKNDGADAIVQVGGPHSHGPDDLPVATTTTKGIVEKATTLEAEGGTAADKFPDVPGVKAMIDEFGTPPPSTSFKAVGTYAFAFQATGGAVTGGGTLAGSNLKEATVTVGGAVGSGSVFTGTWRCMGYSATNTATVWVRIS